MIMKKFLISSVFLYFASVNIFSSGHAAALTGKQIVFMKECAHEYNADEKKYVGGVNAKLAEENLAEATCMLACGIRKNFAKVTESDPLKIWYNATMKLIALASNNGFDKAAVQQNWNFTIQEATNSVENCYSNMKNECDFLNCTDFANGPLWAAFFYLGSHPVENPIYTFDQ